MIALMTMIANQLKIRSPMTIGSRVDYNQRQFNAYLLLRLLLLALLLLLLVLLSNATIKMKRYLATPGNDGSRLVVFELIVHSSSSCPLNFNSGCNPL